MLLVVVVARAAAAYGGEAAALRAAARVKSQLRRKLIGHCLRLGPAWLGGQQPGRIAAQATRGLDGLDPYFARYLPQLVLSVLVPAAVVVTVTAADWISGVVIAVTLPLIPLFAALVGLHTKAATRRQWRLLAQLGGHFLDVVQGLPTLKAFGRAKFQEQVIAKVTERAPVRGHGDAARRVPVRAGPGAVRGPGHGRGRGRDRAAAAVRAHAVPDRAAGAPAHPGGVPAAAGGRRPVPRQRGGHAPPPRASSPILDTPLPPRTAPARPPGRGRPGSRPALGHDTAGRGDRGLPRPRPSGPGSPQPDHPPRRADRAHRAERSREDHRCCGCCCGSPGQRREPSASAEPTWPPSPPDPWRAQIAWVPQHPRLFDGSVADNIALGQPGASRAAIEDAARLAGAAAFIEALPRRLRHPAGRAGGPAVGRAAPAARPGPGVPARRSAAAARRADRPPRPGRRRRDRWRHPRPAGRAHDHPGHPPVPGHRRRQPGHHPRRPGSRRRRPGPRPAAPALAAGR